jgi:hypothetical protein
LLIIDILDGFRLQKNNERTRVLDENCNASGGPWSSNNSYPSAGKSEPHGRGNNGI